MYIEESDLSSISNAGTTNKMINFITAEGSTVNLHNSDNIKIIQDKYDAEGSMSSNSMVKGSGEAGIFPKIHADTVQIPSIACDDSPLESADNITGRKGLIYEESESPSHNSQVLSRRWTHTPHQLLV